jgi:hypothetical protein
MLVAKGEVSDVTVVAIRAEFWKPRDSLIAISSVLAGQELGIKEVDDGILDR